jgi:hypothetical protein
MEGKEKQREENLGCIKKIPRWIKRQSSWMKMNNEESGKMGVM